jgi:hypothetical protein
MQVGEIGAPKSLKAAYVNGLVAGACKLAQAGKVALRWSEQFHEKMSLPSGAHTGDFNARSSQWGDTRTNARGRMLSDWAGGLGLLLTNRGSTSTCVA